MSYTERNMAIDAQTLQAALTGYLAEQERINKAIAEIRERLRGGRGLAKPGPAAEKPKRTISAAARKRMAAAQKKRWAEYRKQQKTEA